MAFEGTQHWPPSRVLDGIPFALLSPARLRAASAPRGLARAVLSDTTINTLRRKSPDLSAAGPLSRWQRIAPFAVTSVVAALVVAWPRAASNALAMALAVPFILVVLLRVAALACMRRPVGAAPKRRARRARSWRRDAAPAPLPTYSVLAALYREAAVAPGLVRSLAALDYPRAKLEIIILLEEDDLETRAALSTAISLPHMRVVVVPKGNPRTKPRALTYGLQAAKGDLIAVYDAEDVVERSQLRRAAAAFAAGDERLACVQARLGIYNPNETWISRQFTLEYAALFEAILPMLERLGFPMPLSGTSNHFRRACLVEAGAWDPYNLTEDADLGMRFARLGYHTAMIESTTWEEAPTTWKVWLGQRTRWIKGWMQAYEQYLYKTDQQVN
jgi:glycosyltransferase XagB